MRISDWSSDVCSSDLSKGSCDAKLTYSNDWANRLPAAFRVYPRATVREAAGVKGGKCNIRVVNFQTAASLQGVLDYYNTLALRSEEHTSELQSLLRISYAVFCLKKQTEDPHKAITLSTS